MSGVETANIRRMVREGLKAGLPPKSAARQVYGRQDWGRTNGRGYHEAISTEPSPSMALAAA
jgi:hypothetical protein